MSLIDRLADELQCMPMELVRIVDDYAKERPHRWQRYSTDCETSVAIVDNKLSCDHNSGCFAIFRSTQTITDGSNRWRIVIDFPSGTSNCFVRTGVMDDGDGRMVADALVETNGRYPDQPKRCRILLNIDTVYKDTAISFRGDRPAVLDFVVDPVDQTMLVTDPTDADFRILIHLPPVVAADWTPCVYVHGRFLVSIVPLPV